MKDEKNIKIDEALNFVEEKIEEVKELSDTRTIELLEKTKSVLETLKK